MTFARLATTALILLKHDSWRIREKRLVIGAIDVGRMLVIAHFRVASETHRSGCCGTTANRFF